MISWKNVRFIFMRAKISTDRKDNKWQFYNILTDQSQVLCVVYITNKLSSYVYVLQRIVLSIMFIWRNERRGIHLKLSIQQIPLKHLTMFSCTICEQTFTRNSDLTRHTASQHMKTQYPCLNCWCTIIKRRKPPTENVMMTQKLYTETPRQISTRRKDNVSDPKTHTENIVIPKTRTEAVGQIYTIHTDLIKKPSGYVQIDSIVNVFDL